MSKFRSVHAKQNFPELEEHILKFWEDSSIFQKTILRGQNRPRYVFFEGPPTANGKPGIHHVLTRAFKDVIPRYKTMQGYDVPRKAGWDCHGLPVEVEVEKQLGLKGKKQIEDYGVAAFNQKCKESVFRYISDWNQLTDRIGFWLDTRHPYQTLDNSYIESCWSILRKLWDQGLLQQDYKITKHCPRCGTSLAEAEASQGMKEDVDDPAVTVKLKLAPSQSLPIQGFTSDQTPTFFLIWTTTPWTLPANAGAAIHQEAQYALCEREEPQKERFILLAHQVEKMAGADVKIVGTAPGKMWASLRYEPLYPAADLMGKSIPPLEQEAAYQVFADESVDPNEGTGIVHLAPAYGDLVVGKKYGLPVFFSVGLDGLFLPAWEKFAGKFFKEADPLIIRDLKERGLLFHSGRIHHSYPFCWRCDTPLLYFAKTSWYIRTTTQKAEMLAANEKINWFPEHIKEGRFGDWLRNNVDWAISRERYWGTPLPLWQCTQCGHQHFISSIQELSEKVGRDLQHDPHLDLHRPYVDELSWPCEQKSCLGNQASLMKRGKEVIDCWFDSGAMPYAQHHYPFENQDEFKKSFPADFICEGVDQTRGWFYTLHALGVLMENKPAYKNCLALGHILDEQGRKMAKRLGNTIDPWVVLQAEGADALRYCLYTSSSPGQPRRFSQNLVRQSLRQFVLTLWNCYGFFVTYAEVEFDKLGTEKIPWQQRAVIDQWILGKLHRLIQKTTTLLDSYEITESMRAITEFVDELSTWYIRRNRDRFWSRLEGEEGGIGKEVERNKRAAYQTLHECLSCVAQLTAPFLPFITEEIWQNLVRSLDQEAAESVHLSSWPAVDEQLLKETTTLVSDMDLVLTVVNLGRAARVESGIKTRQPLQAVTLQVPTVEIQKSLLRFEREIKEELNVEQVKWVESDAQLLEYQLKPNLPKMGKKYGPLIKEIQKLFAETEAHIKKTWVHALLQQKEIELITSSQTVILQPDEVLLHSKPLPGFAAQTKDGLVVALRTEITPELYERGVARELIRTLGEIRKQAGCNVNDQVQIGYFTQNPVLMEVLARQSTLIAQETLSDFHPGLLDTFSVQSQVDIEEDIIQLTLDRNKK